MAHVIVLVTSRVLLGCTLFCSLRGFLITRPAYLRFTLPSFYYLATANIREHF